MRYKCDVEGCKKEFENEEIGELAEELYKHFQRHIEEDEKEWVIPSVEAVEEMLIDLYVDEDSLESSTPVVSCEHGAQGKNKIHHHMRMLSRLSKVNDEYKKTIENYMNKGLPIEVKDDES